MKTNRRKDPTLLDTIRRVLPGSRAKIGANPSEIAVGVFRATDDYSGESVWCATKELVRAGDVEQREVSHFGQRFLYKLTAQGERNRRGRALVETEIKAKRARFSARVGERPCPCCNRTDTASEPQTKKKTFPVVRFFCFDCEKTFNSSSKITERPETIKRGVSVMTKSKKTKKSAKPSAKKVKTTAKSARKPSVPTDKKPTNLGRIRDLFKNRKRATMDELLELTGWNRHVLHSAMAALRKTKTPGMALDAQFDREEQTYTKQQ